MISVNDVFKIYNEKKEDEVVALQGISFNILENEILAIIGPSGCGKSTLLNLLGVMDSPTSGEIFFSDTNIISLTENQKSEFRNREIGFIFQNFLLDNNLTVEENIAVPLMIRGENQKNISSKVKKILLEMDLYHKINVFPSKLSGGEKQRVAICRALVGDPKLILADEPTGNLDSKMGAKIIALLKSLAVNGRSVVLVTHKNSEAIMCNRLIELKDGKIIKTKEINHEKDENV